MNDDFGKTGHGEPDDDPFEGEDTSVCKNPLEESTGEGFFLEGHASDSILIELPGLDLPVVCKFLDAGDDCFHLNFINCSTYSVEYFRQHRVDLSEIFEFAKLNGLGVRNFRVSLKINLPDRSFENEFLFNFGTSSVEVFLSKVFSVVSSLLARNGGVPASEDYFEIVLHVSPLSVSPKPPQDPAGLSVSEDSIDLTVVAADGTVKILGITTAKVHRLLATALAKRPIPVTGSPEFFEASGRPKMVSISVRGAIRGMSARVVFDVDDPPEKSIFKLLRMIHDLLSSSVADDVWDIDLNFDI